jgi:hypothetical protein
MSITDTFLKNDTIQVAIWIADRNLKKADRDLFFKIAIRTFRIAIQNGLQSKAGSTTGSKQSPTLQIMEIFYFCMRNHAPKIPHDDHAMFQL